MAISNSDLKSIFGELKRRKVFRVGGAYMVVAWLMLQVVDVVVPMLELPNWVGKLVLLLLIVGLPIATIAYIISHRKYL